MRRHEQERPWVLIRKRSLVWVAVGVALVCTVSMLYINTTVIQQSSVVGHAIARAAKTLTSTQSTCTQASLAADPIAAENTCTGTGSWQLSASPDRPSDIEGFTVPASVNIGSRIALYVSTSSSEYSFYVYRLGWYGGQGARLMYTSAGLRGIQQPAPNIDPATRMVSCDNWRDPVTLSIPTTWVSGAYIVKFLSSTGGTRYTPFVVRNDASHSTMLFQVSFMTDQAYNQWGGYSLYLGSSSPSITPKYAQRAYVVSFDRPYQNHEGLGDLPNAELNLLRWLEREGFNISYTTDMDVDASTNHLLQHRLLIVGGHSEYGTTAMRQNMTAARDAGVSLAFFSANSMYWHARLQASSLGPDREVVCYRDTSLDPLASSDPLEATVRWRDPPLKAPENALLGEMYNGVVLAGTTDPMVLAPGIVPFLQGTRLSATSRLPDLVGGEYDSVINNGLTPGTLSVLASSPVVCSRTSTCADNGTPISDATVYTESNGARVFDAGTFYWSWGLDNDVFDNSVLSHAVSSTDFQRLTVNLLTYLLER